MSWTKVNEKSSSHTKINEKSSSYTKDERTSTLGYGHGPYGHGPYGHRSGFRSTNGE